MEKQVYISINSRQSIENESDTIEMFTDGILKEQDGGFRLSYDKPANEEDPGGTTVLEIDRTGRVSLTAGGRVDYQLILEQGKRTLGSFFMGGNDILVGANTSRIEYDLGEDGGRISLKYTLDANMVVMSENEVTLEITPLKAINK